MSVPFYLVLPQPLRPSVLRTTEASKWFLTRVNSQMSVVLVSLIELHMTVRASVEGSSCERQRKPSAHKVQVLSFFQESITLVLAHIVGCCVHLQVVDAAESFPAEAYIRLLSSVNSLVGAQLVGTGKTFVAYLTHVRSFASVSSQVHSHLVSRNQSKAVRALLPVRKNYVSSWKNKLHAVSTENHN